MTSLVSMVPKIVTLPVDQLRPAPWNYKVEGSKEQIEKLTNSILASQSCGVLCVRELSDDASGATVYEVIDGNHRLEAVRSAGWTEVTCENFGTITKAQAIVISRQRNEQWFANDAAKFEQLMTLDVLPEFSADELADMLPDMPDEIPGSAGESIDDDSGKPTDFKSITLTTDQYMVVMEAVDNLRASESGDVSDGRALELICADYLAGT